MSETLSNKAVLISIDQILEVGRLSERAEKLVRSTDWSTIEVQQFVLSEYKSLQGVLSMTFPGMFTQVLVIAVLIKAADRVSTRAYERIRNMFPTEAEKCELILLYFGSQIMHRYLEPDVADEIQKNLAGYLQ